MLAIASLWACSDEPATPAAPPPSGGPVAGWPTSTGDPGGSRYSPLTQIDRDNVTRLEIAWTVHTGDWPGGRPDAKKTAFQATPLLRDETLYFCTPMGRVFAIDAETGAERWIYDAGGDLSQREWTMTCRGVAYWEGPDAGPCRARVFLGTATNELHAIDAHTGRVCVDFGSGGRVDLDRGLGEIQPAEVYMTSAPTVIGDVVVTGALVADNRRVDPPGGVIRAFDVRTGALRWYFDPVPPGTPPLPPGPDGSPRFHRGTPNAWSIPSVDPERNLIYIPFGGPSPDFFGGLRGGFDYYGSSVVALDGATGAPRWRFQTVHHDLWDYDIASQPVLIDLRRAGRTIAALAQATKMGHVFLLDRDSGAPLFPVEERPVPQTDVPGEFTSPTQPFPTFPAPLHPHHLDPDEVGTTPIDAALCRGKIAKLRNEGIFTPPSFEGSLQYPGTAGGFNWGSVAFDPERQLLVANMNRMAQVQTVLPREDVDEANPPSGVRLQDGAPYYTRGEVFSSLFGAPCTPLPWGTLVALDLETGEKRWEVPFGTTEDLVPIGFGLDVGLPSMGGPIATANGLVFIGASLDDYLRAYDIETGEELWRQRLPAGGQATPMTYRLGPDARQYIVIAAGGHATLGTTLGDSLIAFALPE